MKHTLITMLALAMGATSLCSAGEAATTVAQPAAESFSFCKWLPSKFAWFDAERDNAENPYIQKFAVSFRAQYQWGFVDPNSNIDNGGRSSNNEFRRLRAGAKATVFEDYKVKMVWNLGGAYSSIKNGKRGTTSASLDAFEVSRDISAVNLTVGKFKPAYTGEYRTSSSKIKTIERSFIVNQLTADKSWGLSFKNENKKDTLGWQIGSWVQGYDDEGLWQEPSLSTQSNAMLGASINYATNKGGRLFLDYMHSFAKTDGSEAMTKNGYDYCGPGAQDVLALSYEYSKDQWYFMGELIGGFNVDRNQDKAENVFGFVLLPTYKFNDNFEGVFRYQLSSGSNAAKIYKRYYTLNSDADSYCDLIQAFYLGMNYYVCASKPDMMKVMLGIEYVDSHGTDGKPDAYGFTGWQFSTALRCNF